MAVVPVLAGVALSTLAARTSVAVFPAAEPRGHQAADHFPGAAALHAVPEDAASAHGTTGTVAPPPEPITAAQAERGAATLISALPFSAARASALDRGRALECLATAIYYEAASESDDGERAVAQVVLNRVRHPALGVHFFHRWKGYWGTAAAFRRPYAGGQPVLGPHAPVAEPVFLPAPAVIAATATAPVAPAPLLQPAHADSGTLRAAPTSLACPTRPCSSDGKVRASRCSDYSLSPLTSASHTCRTTQCSASLHPPPDPAR